MSTPDFEADLMARIAALRAADYDIEGAGRNTWPDVEQPVGGLITERMTVVRFVTERQHRYAGGQAREVDMQVLDRFPAAELGAAKVRARALYDASHLSGAFTGVSGTEYLDVWAIDGPVILEPNYVSLNLTLWVPG